MNNKHLIKEIEKIIELHGIDVASAGYNSNTNSFWVNKLESLILSDKTEDTGECKCRCHFAPPLFMTGVNPQDKHCEWCPPESEKLSQDWRERLKTSEFGFAVDSEKLIPFISQEIESSNRRLIEKIERWRALTELSDTDDRSLKKLLEELKEAGDE